MKVALFALMAFTVPGLASAQVHPEDYPPSALRNNEEGRTSYHLQYGTSGRVTSCTITRSSGYKDLDITSCRLLVARSRFQRGGAGEKDGFVDWRIPNGGPPTLMRAYPGAQSDAAYEAGKAQAEAAMRGRPQ